MIKQFSLLKTRRFLPLFIVQFLGAFNDNLFKSMLSVRIAYGLWVVDDISAPVAVSLAAALFILPFVIFAPLAGALADKYDKAHIIRHIKLAEIIIALLACTGFYLGNIPLMLLVLFALGAQSAFFAPSKFAILPQHLSAEELISGNALLNTGTYIAILTGTILGSLLALNTTGVTSGLAVLLILSLIGYGASRLITAAQGAAPEIPIRLNILHEGWKILSYATHQGKAVFIAILGSAWFYFLGAMMLAQFPNFTKQALSADQVVLAFFMLLFSVGVSLGGLLNNRILNSKVSIRYVPFAALGIAIFTGDLFWTAHNYEANHDVLQNFRSFFVTPTGLHLAFDICALAIAGGLYIVPLKAYVQAHTAIQTRARVLAAASLIDATAILTSAVLAMVLLGMGWAVIDLFALLAIMGLGVSGYLHLKLRD